MSGKMFNSLGMGRSFVKLTNQFENHNGMQFQTGLNVDPIPFNPKGKCQPGGIYFCDLYAIPIWLNYNSNPMVFVRSVTIPDDALIYIEKFKYKTDKMILGERVKIGDLDVWEDDRYCKRAVINGLALKYVINQTPKICFEAVKQNGLALQYVKKQTDDVCFEAVKQNGLALQYVRKQTPYICLQAVKQNGLALQYVNEQTLDICLEAVKQNGLALQYVNEQTHEICEQAFKQNYRVYQYIQEPTDEMLEEMLKRLRKLRNSKQ